MKTETLSPLDKATVDSLFGGNAGSADLAGLPVGQRCPKMRPRPGF